MARNVLHLLHREGRYYARLVIPVALRSLFGGRHEFRAPLGADRREAQRALPGHIAKFQAEIATARSKKGVGTRERPSRTPCPLTIEQIQRLDYQGFLEVDEHQRNMDDRWASIQINNQHVQELREGIQGKLDNFKLNQLVGNRIDHYRDLGHTDVEDDTTAWRNLARKLCQAQYEALERMAERDEGDFYGSPRNPALAEEALPPDPPPPLPLISLFEQYIGTRKAIGSGQAAERRWRPVFAHLAAFSGHGDARRLTKQEVKAWRDDLILTRSPKTVSDVYLAALRTVLSWALREDKLVINVAQDVRQDVRKKVSGRERGFTLEEATAILKFSRGYTCPTASSGKAAEHPGVTAAKRWVPMLCAFTGARVTEITQLRKEDLRTVGAIPIMRITPEAGTVKSGGYRDVPLHRQIIAEGFLHFVDACSSGPLFYRAAAHGSSRAGATAVSGRLSQWLSQSRLIPTGVAPSHGWRHRFKTVGRELAASDRVLDAICGHAGRTAGDAYGDVTDVAKAAVIDTYPDYDI